MCMCCYALVSCGLLSSSHSTRLVHTSPCVRSGLRAVIVECKTHTHILELSLSLFLLQVLSRASSVVQRLTS
uniref:Putative secreted protein n=1 Tax=Anopheles darlingi TaxID=43151 RepID=A0A2M4DR06_ANODA